MSMLEAKKNYIISEAVNQFSSHPIKDVTIKDIASAAGVGEATVYRYFGTKGDLILACAEKLEKLVSEIFIEKTETHPAYKALERFYNAYLTIFTDKIYLYRFLNEFDAFVINEGVSGLGSYEDAIDTYKQAFIAAYERGISDGSVRKVEDIELFYYSTTHAVLSLCKKLSAEAPVIRQDKMIEKHKEISTLINVILGALNGQSRGAV